jgi:hypothetical protein
MPDPAPASELAEAARKKAEVMQGYKDYVAARPATTMSHEDQVADFARRNKEARDRRTLEKAKLTSAQMDADRAAGIKQAPAGSYFKEKALAESGDLAQAGQGVRKVSQTVLDKTDTTTAKVGGMAAKVITGADVRNIVQGGAVLGDLSGQAMIAKDSSIQAGYEKSQARNEISSDDLQSKVGEFQAALKGSGERRVAALSTFRSAGMRARDQAELGAYQDLKMKVGPEEYSKDEVLGKAAPGAMDYNEGDVVKREDALHGSTYGKFKRAVLTGGVSTSGKLSDEQKADVARLQGELDTEKSARNKEHEDREAGSLKGQAKRFVMFQGSKLTPDEKTSIKAINSSKANHEQTAKQTEAQLKSEKDKIKAQVDKLKSAQPSGILYTDERKARHAELQRQIDALQPTLDDSRKKLADHRAAAKAGSLEFEGQVSDIHARAKGNFTRAESAARAEKEEQIKGIRTGATAAAAFTDKHAGETINHYNRVGGMIDRMEDPTKMEATRLGTAADYANKGFEHVEDAGKIVGGSADDARDMQEQGKYLKAGITAGVGVGVESAKLAGAALPGVAHLGDGTQKVISGGLKGVGMIGQALTEDAAKAERERTHSRDVVEGRRRETLKSKSFVTTRQPKNETPSILGGVGELAKAALGADVVKDSIKDVVGLGDPEGEREATSDTRGDDVAKPGVETESSVDGVDRPEEVHGLSGGEVGKPEEVHGLSGGEVGKPEEVHGLSGGEVGKPEEVHGLSGGEVGKPEEVHGLSGEGIDKPAEVEELGVDGVEEPEAPESFEDDIRGNIEDESYEAAADGLVDKGTEKAGVMLAGPTSIPKADAAVHKPAAPVQTGPVPSPAPGPAAPKLSWWQRMWKAVKRGARSVGRGVKSVGRKLWNSAKQGARSITRGVKSAGKWIGRRFGR